MADNAKRRGRAYGLGERNPNTLPGVYKDSESVEDNRAGTAYWRQLGKLARANRLPERVRDPRG